MSFEGVEVGVEVVVVVAVVVEPLEDDVDDVDDGDDDEVELELEVVVFDDAGVEGVGVVVAEIVPNNIDGGADLVLSIAKAAVDVGLTAAGEDIPAAGVVLLLLLVSLIAFFVSLYIYILKKIDGGFFVWCFPFFFFVLLVCKYLYRVSIYV